MEATGAVPESKYYRDRPLFGGAITADIPMEFLDASTIREVPNSQEVFLLQDGNCSIIIEILERAQPPTHPVNSDMEALQYHYNDATSSEYTSYSRSGYEVEEVTNVWHKEPLRLLGFPNLPAYFITATQKPYRSVRATPEAIARMHELPEFTWIEMTMIRLPMQQTDILISVNIPVMAGSYAREDMRPEVGRVPYWVEKGCEWSESVRSNMEVRDWGLFNG